MCSYAPEASYVYPVAAIIQYVCLGGGAAPRCDLFDAGPPTGAAPPSSLINRPNRGRLKEINLTAPGDSAPTPESVFLGLRDEFFREIRIHSGEL